ncbi:MAG: ROK family protein [Bacteroidetes bacterium]|nr:ROK family protein [Bacteroidota bacterium]
MRLGIDFGGTNLKVGVFSDDGEEIIFNEALIEDIRNTNDLLQDILEYTNHIVEDYNLNQGGFAVKGLVNKESGILESDIGLAKEFSGINLKNAFGDFFNIPFLIENDARSFAWGEWLYGAGQNSKVMSCLTLGTGFGSALVKDGKPYEGSDSLGGILGGHISIDKNGPECACGNRGCLELYCSATALKKRLLNDLPELSKESDPVKVFFENIRLRKNSGEKVLDDFINDLAIGIVNIVHAYGPEIVVLGGGVMESDDIIIPRIKKIVSKRAWTVPRGKVSIVKSKLGNRAATLGAAFLNEAQK